MYGDLTLSTALRQRGLSSKKGPSHQQGRMLLQGDREIGQMTASVGWALVRLIDGADLDHCIRVDVAAARQLLARLDR